MTHQRAIDRERSLNHSAATRAKTPPQPAFHGLPFAVMCGTSPSPPDHLDHEIRPRPGHSGFQQGEFGIRLKADDVMVIDIGAFIAAAMDDVHRTRRGTRHADQRTIPCHRRVQRPHRSRNPLLRGGFELAIQIAGPVIAALVSLRQCFDLDTFKRKIIRFSRVESAIHEDKLQPVEILEKRSVRPLASDRQQVRDRCVELRRVGIAPILVTRFGQAHLAQADQRVLPGRSSKPALRQIQRIEPRRQRRVVVIARDIRRHLPCLDCGLGHQATSERISA